MAQRKLLLEKGWLHLPIRRDAPGHYVRFLIDGEPLTELYLTLCTEPDFYCAMDLSAHLGCEVTIVSDTAPQGLLDALLPGEALTASNPLYAGLYREALRPQYHFSSRRGWLNDPNGLFFDGAQYHLYYQHNPYATTHSGVNICWGHAVSPDGVCWQEQPEAIHAVNSTEMIASGSCIIDREGVAGYGKGALIAAYTRLGTCNYRTTPRSEHPSLGQFFAYSLDGGRSFTPFEGNPVIPTEGGKSWRDPRLFEQPEGGFGCAVYETDETGNCVSFYRSSDLHHWVRTSRADNLYECPDLFRLSPVNGGEARWVLYGADGMYRLGTYENGVFHQQGERRPLDYGACTYAGQTWNHHDDAEGRMHISFLTDVRYNWDANKSYPDMPFGSCMTVACLLTLVRTEEGYRLLRNPVPALSTLREGEGDALCVQSARRAELVPQLSGDMEFDLEAQAPVELRIGCVGFSYDPRTGHVCFSGGREAVLLKKGPLHVRLLTDRTSCEFFLQGEASATYGLPMRDLALQVSSDADFALTGRRWSMRSIWAG